MWFDAHNHLQDPRFGESLAPILKKMRDVGVICSVVNATREEDWPAVEELAAAQSDFILPAFGIHPWHAHTAEHGWRDRLAANLEKFPHASVGECGLDRWVETPDLSIQRPVFLSQLSLAREMGRPITIHCLKAWGELFDAFAEEEPPRHFLMHSFGGSIETARRLVPLGAYFSFSGYFLQPRKSAVREMFRQLPRERILLETDAPDMLPPEGWISHALPAKSLNHPANLAAIGRGLAEILGMSEDELAELTCHNARSFLDL